MEEKKEEQKIINIEKKLAKIELGKDYTAEIFSEFSDDKDQTKKISFKFKVHMPTMKEDLKISVKEEQILGQKIIDADVELAARILATLDVVIHEIYFTDKEDKFNKFNGGFIKLTEHVKSIGRFYKEVVFPIYNEYIVFLNSTEIGIDDLKNSLAQTGKR